MLLYIPFPSWIKPEIFPGLPVRWYGLMYIVAFAVAFYFYRRQIKERNFPMSDDALSSLFFWGILALLLGARIFSTLVYEQSDYYWRNPWMIFWPFRGKQFTGLQGMSYHGGAIAGVLAVFIYAKVKKISFREISDMFAASVPLGYTFGRLGNFINGELYGRITESPIGMLFPGAAKVLSKETAAQEIASRLGINAGEYFVNLPRHPSQLYEAFFEGIVLWLLIWFFRNRKPFKGFLVGLYFLGYGFFRFFIEYFREPDSDLGYPIQLVKGDVNTAFYHPLTSFSTGQILCFLMIIFGVVWLIAALRLPDREPVRVYETQTNAKPVNKEEAKKEHNKQRKIRKKLR
jgi:phosphatidylglycerol:prolipoprotein diacylglycerol transferase